MRDEDWRREAASYPWGIELDVRFADQDVNQHLNNVAFVRFLEEGRVRMHHDLGGKEKLGFRPIVAAVNVNFLAEGGWPGRIEVRSGIVRFGRTSYVVGQALFQGGRCICIAEAVMVNRAEDGNGGAPLPETLTRPLEGLRIAASATGNG